jgi:hypothetical protein
VYVTVSPSSASVPVSGTKQFTATVTNATTQLVNWSVNGAPGGNSTVGLISTAGIYTAPAFPPSGGSVTVQAASAVSPSAIGSANVTITAPPPAPVLTSIAPNSGTQSTKVQVTLNGSNFASGATVSVSGSGASVSGVSVVSSSRITATFTIAATAAPGARPVSVTTAAGTSTAQSFTVVAAPTAKPTLTSMTPNSGVRGSSIHVALTGTNFAAPFTITVAGGGVSVSDVVVVNSTSATAIFHVNRGALRRSRDTTVATSSGSSNGLPFTIR